MSLEAWGDEGNTVDEGSFNAGQEAMYEDLEPLIDIAKIVVKTQIYEVGKLENGISEEMVGALHKLLKEVDKAKGFKPGQP